MKRTPIRRKTPLARGTAKLRRTPLKPWRRKPGDKVTEDVAQAVQRRDKFCVGYLLGAEGPCEMLPGFVIPATTVWLMTLDHVHDGPTPAMGKRAPSDPDHLITICRAHGVQSWELSHRPLIRKYLTLVQQGVPSVDAAVFARGVP